MCLGIVGLIIERPLSLWHRISWVGGAALAVVGTAFVGLVYFNDVLPNTYYAKDMGLGRALDPGIRYLINALQAQGGSGIDGVLLILQVSLLAAGVYAVVTRFPRCGYLLAIIAGQALFILKSGGDWMQGGRFAAPAIIPLLVIELLGVVSISSYMGRRAQPIVASGVRGVVAAGLLASSTGLIVSTTSIHPFPAPVWQLSGIDDRAVIASGGYLESYAWATLPSYLQCLGAGQLVASSEVGYLGFSRQDLRILDIRGLTDRSIAKESPSSVKFEVGVDDPSLMQSTSAVGRVLIQAKPAVIATFDEIRQKTAFGGAYKLVKVPGLSHMSIYVRASSNGLCRLG